MCTGNHECIFYKRLEKIINKYVKSQHYNVFHYTKSLRHIMSSSHLELHSHQFLNSKGNNEELICGVNLVLSEMKNYDDFVHLDEHFKSYIQTGLEVYTCSFCELKRSRYAFRKYGRSNISFKRSFFSKLKSNASKHQTHCLYGKVIYKEKNQKMIIKLLFDCYEKYSILCDDRYVSFFTFVTLILPLLKLNRHNQDKEFRIISMQIRGRDGQLATPHALDEAHFTLSDIKHISFSFQKKN